MARFPHAMGGAPMLQLSCPRETVGVLGGLQKNEAETGERESRAPAPYLGDSPQSFVG